MRLRLSTKSRLCPVERNKVFHQPITCLICRPSSVVTVGNVAAAPARVVCKSQPTAVATFEAALFPSFQTILLQDVQEFVPYVFQVGQLVPAPASVVRGDWLFAGDGRQPVNVPERGEVLELNV